MQPSEFINNRKSREVSYFSMKKNGIKLSSGDKSNNVPLFSISNKVSTRTIFKNEWRGAVLSHHENEYYPYGYDFEVEKNEAEENAIEDYYNYDEISENNDDEWIEDAYDEINKECEDTGDIYEINDEINDEEYIDSENDDSDNSDDYMGEYEVTDKWIIDNEEELFMQMCD